MLFVIACGSTSIVFVWMLCEILGFHLVYARVKKNQLRL